MGLHVLELIFTLPHTTCLLPPPHLGLLYLSPARTVCSYHTVPSFLPLVLCTTAAFCFLRIRRHACTVLLLDFVCSTVSFTRHALPCPLRIFHHAFLRARRLLRITCFCLTAVLYALVHRVTTGCHLQPFRLRSVACRLQLIQRFLSTTSFGLLTAFLFLLFSTAAPPPHTWFYVFASRTFCTFTTVSWFSSFLPAFHATAYAIYYYCATCIPACTPWLPALNRLHHADACCAFSEDALPAAAVPFYGCAGWRSTTTCTPACCSFYRRFLRILPPPLPPHCVWPLPLPYGTAPGSRHPSSPYLLGFAFLYYTRRNRYCAAGVPRSAFSFLPSPTTLHGLPFLGCWFYRWHVRQTFSAGMHHCSGFCYFLYLLHYLYTYHAWTYYFLNCLHAFWHIPHPVLRHTPFSAYLQFPVLAFLLRLLLPPWFTSTPFCLLPVLGSYHFCYLHFSHLYCYLPFSILLLFMPSTMVGRVYTSPPYLTTTHHVPIHSNHLLLLPSFSFGMNFLYILVDCILYLLCVSLGQPASRTSISATTHTLLTFTITLCLVRFSACLCLRTLPRAFTDSPVLHAPATAVL